MKNRARIVLSVCILLGLSYMCAGTLLNGQAKSTEQHTIQERHLTVREYTVKKQGDDERALSTSDQKQELIDRFIMKVEDAYQYMYWFEGEGIFFEDGGRARKDSLQVDVYWSEGSWYFVPLECCDAEAEIDGGLRKVWQNKFTEGKYVFYDIGPYTGEGRDRYWWHIHYNAHVLEPQMEKFTYLGTVEINTAVDTVPETAVLERNEFIDAALDFIRTKGELPEGNYTIYIGYYMYSMANEVNIMGAISLDETYRWFWARVTRNSDGSYEALFFPTNGTSEMFATVEEIPFTGLLVRNTIQAGRLAIDLEIKGQGTAEGQRQVQASGSSMNAEQEQDPEEAVSASEISREEACERIEDMYNYYQWFYVKLPYEIECAFKDGETYMVYTDGKGNIFWDQGKGYFGIYRSELQTEITDLHWSSYSFDGYFPYHDAVLRELGTMVWHTPELQMPELPALEEDGYTNAVEEYIQRQMVEKGQDEEYIIYYGRYEMLSEDVRNISVAVIGEDSFFEQFWVTRWQDGTYGCMPVNGGYAEDGSIEKEIAERIVQLRRLVRKYPYLHVEVGNGYED